MHSAGLPRSTARRAATQAPRFNKGEGVKKLPGANEAAPPARAMTNRHIRCCAPESSSPDFSQTAFVD
ncbi:MAG: hypothetical protein DMF61_09925 [Blastocatellia bacterium AA13]|nr:MAG: hypothetical protein DMF61_09925 [Blastocatellia bacterium AA13]